MSISYKLHKNHLVTDQEQYRAAVEYSDVADMDKVIDLMMYQGAGLTRSDVASVLESYEEAILHLLQDGRRVHTPMALYGVSLKGKFEDEQDSFDPARHQLLPNVVPGLRLRHAMAQGLHPTKAEASRAVPNPRVLTDLSNGGGHDSLHAGGMARLTGYRLKHDPADPAQGLFLLPVTAAGEPDDTRPKVRIEVYGRNTDKEQLFMVPADAAPGSYLLELCSRLNTSDLRTGRLADPITL